MEAKTILTNTAKIIFPMLLGGAILYWMYRGEDFGRISHILTEEMNWTWMLLSFPFGILAQMFRGWRWKQTLDPIEDLSPSTVKLSSSDPRIRARSTTCIYAVFISYAASLVIPRIGEFSRCAILKRYDGWLVTAVCGVAVLIVLHLLLKNFSIYNKVKMTLSGIWEGVLSLRGIKNLPLYLFFSIGIWVMYFLHYYLTFFCFDFTANLGIGCALVSFVVANFAVIVPTPNGAGPWHFAIKTMLILYGVADEQALWFVLIVHSVQTLLVVALGIYAWAALLFMKRLNPKTT